MKTLQEPKSPGVKRYTEGFKQEALALIAAGRTRSQVGRELGVSVWALSQWQRRAAGPPKDGTAPQNSPTDSAAAASLTAEIALLRKQPAKAELHATILKKALAIVGREPAEDLK